MKFSIKSRLAIIGLMITFLIGSIEIQYTYASTVYATVKVKSYTEFYRALSSCVVKKSPSIEINVTKYDSRIYDASKAINAIIKNNPRLAYYVSSIQLRRQSTSNVTSLRYQFLYTLYKKSAPAAITSINPNSGQANKPQFKEQKDLSASVALPSLTTIEDISSFVKTRILSGDSCAEFKIDDVRNLSFQKINQIVDQTIDENLDYCYFSSWNKAISVAGNSGIYKVTFKLYYSKEKIVAMEKELQRKIDQIMNLTITKGMSDYEKELSLHDYIIRNTSYDYNNYLKKSVPEESNLAYGVLVNGTGICDGYSKAIKRLMNAAGFECRIITGQIRGPAPRSHVWNLVKIENEYYHVDATYNDPVINGAGADKNAIRHTYFNLTDKEMDRDHSWDNTKYPGCSSNKFSFIEIVTNHKN